MQGIKYGKGDVVEVRNHVRIPDKTLATVFNERRGTSIPVTHRGTIQYCVHEQLTLYRRHIDSPLRAEDDKRFWKLNPPPKRAIGAK